MRAADQATDRDIETLKHAVREAGELALSKFRATFKSWTKLGDSPVSEVDIAVNDLLRDRLSTARPDYAWLSEESTDDTARLSADKVWIVDPIDGTRAFIAGKPDWSVSVALVQAGRPIAAALFAPAEDTMLIAQVGRGATRNGVPISAATGEGFDGARAAGPPRVLEMLVKLRPGVVALPKVHSLALRIARVATSELDVAMAGRNCHDWDIAAADLIVNEAGARLTGFDGSEVRYNGANPTHPALLACGAARHAELVGIFRAHTALWS